MAIEANGGRRRVHPSLSLARRPRARARAVFESGRGARKQTLLRTCACARAQPAGKPWMPLKQYRLVVGKSDGEPDVQDAQIETLLRYNERLGRFIDEEVQDFYQSFPSYSARAAEGAAADGAAADDAADGAAADDAAAELLSKLLRVSPLRGERARSPLMRQAIENYPMQTLLCFAEHVRSSK